MDDGFTIIQYGDQEVTQAGPAVVSNPQLPYQELDSLGEEFVERLQLKMVPVPLLKNITLIDSPGMLNSTGERGYDFVKATQFFVDRADWVLFTFDVASPGTTSESLEVFTQVLRGFDHKLMIVLNKVDVCESVQDAIRAYGTLAWNLARVLSYKDMPTIHAMFTPTDGNKDVGANKTWSLKEFADTRNKVVRRIVDAPKSHADNIVTELQRYTDELTMHAALISEMRRQLWWHRTLRYLTLLVFVGVASALLFRVTGGDYFWTAMPGVALVIGVTLLQRMVQRRQRAIADSLADIFDRLYGERLLHEPNPDYLRSTFAAVEQRVLSSVERFGLFSMPNLGRGARRELEGIAPEIQTLRSSVHSILKNK
jgi:hypothetical protein